MGEPNVDAMLRKISSRQLTEWMAFSKLEPFGEERADLRMGILAALIANVNRDPKKQPAPYEPDDFMPNFDGSSREKPQQTAKEIYSMFKNWALMSRKPTRKQ